MTEDEMYEQIRRERLAAEKEKRTAVSRTVLSIVGTVLGLCVVGKTIDSDGFGQWGGIISIVLMILGLRWLHSKIIGE